MATYVVVLAYDRAVGGGLGPGTLARLDGAIKAVEDVPWSGTRPIFVVGAHLEAGAPLGTESMKELMAEYLVARNFRVFVAEGEAWGTYAEVHACLDAIAADADTRPVPVVLFASSSGHRTRVECAAVEWLQAHAKSFALRFEAVGVPLSLLERCREAVALVLLGLGLRRMPPLIGSVRRLIFRV